MQSTTKFTEPWGKFTDPFDLVIVLVRVKLKLTLNVLRFWAYELEAGVTLRSLAKKKIVTLNETWVCKNVKLESNFYFFYLLSLNHWDNKNLHYYYCFYWLWLSLSFLTCIYQGSINWKSLLLGCCIVKGESTVLIYANAISYLCNINYVNVLFFINKQIVNYLIKNRLR